MQAERAPRVLVVDDDPIVLRAVERLLRSAHSEWEIVAVRTAEEALEQAASRRFDMVVADLDMPEMGGAELLSICAERHPEMVRIVHSAQIETASDELIQLAFDVVLKSGTAGRLLGAVELAVGVAQKRRPRAGNGDH